MANIRIKTDSQQHHENHVLRSYGINPQRASNEQREYAQEISRRTAEIERRLQR